jgi:hypothetical protein
VPITANTAIVEIGVEIGSSADLGSSRHAPSKAYSPATAKLAATEVAKTKYRLCRRLKGLIGGVGGGVGLSIKWAIALLPIGKGKSSIIESFVASM